jgi:2',3'-cyclic-nucleotide 2'-phosphodiesterase (5'-nucleotidase family)
MLHLFFPLILISIFSYFTENSDAQQANKEIIILHTNDFHGRIQPIKVLPGNATSQTGEPKENGFSLEREGEAGGFAALVEKIDNLKEEYGKDDFILLDAGDNFSDGLIGNLTKGEAVITLMNETGYDMAALGNHDFDYGWERTQELSRLAKFPMRGANVFDREGLPFLGEPFKIFEENGVKIAVLALSYRNTPLTGNSENLKGLTFKSGIEAVQLYLPRLQKQADIMVILSHEGIAYDREMAREIPEIDLIVGGHSHDVTQPAEKVNNTWIVHALSNGTMLGITRLKVEDKKLVEVETEIETLYVSQLDAEKSICQTIDRIREPYLDTLRAEIGEAAELIPRNYKSESPFDRLVGQILLEETGAEIALLPGVGYGVSLKPGTIYREDLYTLIPHPAKLATVQMNGFQIKKTLEQSATNIKPGNPQNIVGGLIQTAGLEWTVDFNQPTGSRVSEVKVGGEPLKDNQEYQVATHSGMVQGIHNYDQIGKGSNIQKTDKILVKLVENYFQENSPVSLAHGNEITVLR